MIDVTKEVWSLNCDTQTDVDGRTLPVSGSHYGIKLWKSPSMLTQTPSPADVLLFTGHGGDINHTNETLARAMLASMAPLLFQTLVKVLESGDLSSELERHVRVNLHLVSPFTHPMPPKLWPYERKTGWQHILKDDKP